MKCAMANCINEATSHLSELCSACKSARYYWNCRSPRARIDRQRKLALYAERFEKIIQSSGNVVRLRKRAR